MPRVIKIAPSTLCASFRRLEEDILAVVESGVDYLHFDCMDGHFVENLTHGPLIIQALRDLTDIPFDVHLMITNPEAQIESYAEAGADHILFQVEVDPRPVRLLSKVKAAGKKAGVVYNPATPLGEVETLLPSADIVMVMSVEPGAAGQAFMPVALHKIRALREMIDRNGYQTLISVDGGINAETAPLVIGAGADVIVSGSWFFRHAEGYAGAVRQLRAMARPQA